jgi:DNA repair protein RecO
LDAVAKGVRRAHSPLAGRLEFAAEASLTMHRGRNLDVITSADLVQRSFASLTRPQTFATAGLFAELVDAFCEPDLPLPDVYALLAGGLRVLAATDDPATLIPRFELRLLDALGLAPPSGACVRCNLAFEADLAWADLDAGGLACAACRPHVADPLALLPDDLVAFRALGAARGGGRAASLRATPAAARAADAFVAYHLGRRPRARGLIDELGA